MVIRDRFRASRPVNDGVARPRRSRRCAMNALVFAACVAVACGGPIEQAPASQAAKGPTVVPLWPGEVPDATPSAGPERTRTVTDRLIAGQPWTEVSNVSRPAMTVYEPSGKNTGAAVVVFPGGGYKVLAIDLEGTEVCDWLVSRGITCVLLKYRVPYSGPYWDERCNCHVTPKSPVALEDAQRAVGLVRAHAAEWHVNPHKIGVLGFSAGGHLAAAISTHFERRLYPEVDAADKVSCRPDFAVLLYPGHLWVDEDRFELNPDVPVMSTMPPQFLLHAEDDDVDSVNHSLVYYVALKNAHVPVEMHLYAQGGHAFGLRRTKAPITRWPRLVESWLESLGML
jgi:acetyl esterase/lipase